MTSYRFFQMVILHPYLTFTDNVQVPVAPLSSADMQVFQWLLYFAVLMSTPRAGGACAQYIWAYQAISIAVGSHSICNFLFVVEMKARRIKARRMMRQGYIVRRITKGSYLTGKRETYISVGNAWFYAV